MSDMWEFKCPVCGDEFITEYTVEEIADSIGCTMDCQCGALLKIKNDLTCSDFSEELCKIYSNYGLDVSKEEAVNSFVEV